MKEYVPVYQYMEALFPRFTEDKGAFIDNKTGFVWQPNYDMDTNYYDAEKWLQKIKGNWRFPAEDEIKTLPIIKHLHGPFEMRGSWFWLDEKDDTTANYYNFNIHQIMSCNKKHGIGHRSIAIQMPFSTDICF